MLALVLVLLLASPYVASVVKAVDQGYTPPNDEALIALRAHDVLAGEFPLIGQPSTAEAYADVDPPDHPGPIEFYLLAVPVGLVGADLGMLVGAGAFNLAAVLVAVWVAFRRAGPAVGLGAAVVAGSIAWSEGLALLTDPISSNMGGIPLLALVVLAWALLDGDVRLVPLAAFVFAFVCQQHLAMVTLGLGVAAWAAVGIVLAVRRWVVDRRAATKRSDAAGITSPWPWLAGGLAVTLVAWSPVIVDQFWGQGNLSRMARFASASERPSLGLRSGVTQALRALGLPPLLARTDLTGNDLIAPLSPVSVGVGLLVAAALVAIVVHRRRSAPHLAALAATTLVLAVIGAVNGANVPASFEADRLNFYRWTFVVSVGVCLALGWAAALSLVSWRPALAARSGPVLKPVGVAAVVLLAGASIAAGRPQERRDHQVFGALRELGPAAEAATRGDHKVLLLTNGASAVISTGPAVGLELVAAGHEIRVLPKLESAYGKHLILEPGEEVDTVILLESGKGSVPAPQPGRLLRRIDLKERARPAFDRLVQEARGQEVVPAADAEAILDEVLVDLVGVTSPKLEAEARDAVAKLRSDPEASIADPRVIALLEKGYLRSPVFDEASLATMGDAVEDESWGDDVLELRLLTPEEAERAFELDLGT